MLNKTLIKIAKIFNNEQITWALGGSLLLKFKGLDIEPHDIDILVSIEDAKKADELLSKISQARQNKSNTNNRFFSTEYFCKYLVDNIEIDLMANLIINYDIQGNTYQYKYILNKETIQEEILVKNTKIPLTTLEDWFILYNIMPDKNEQIKLLEYYFKNNKANHPKILKNQLTSNIPEHVKEKISVLLTL